MRLAVTGRSGQVVRSLAERASPGTEVVAIGRPELDLAGEQDRIVAALKTASPDVIVSAAAYTAVDRAESEPDLAFAINEQGSRAVAIAARELGVPLIHVSTDYVFDGSKTTPYVEEDQTTPAGVYGASKLAGERAVLNVHPNTAVLRTAWVYSPFGANFPRTMLRLAQDREEIGVVADQRGNPTSALDIADGILAIAENLRRDDDEMERGVFHMTASGDASWAEFAKGIFAISSARGGPSARVKPIRTVDYPTPANRPSNSMLDCSKLERVHGVRLPHWHTSIQDIVPRLIVAHSEG